MTTILFYGYLAGAAAFLLYQGVSYALFRRTVRRWKRDVSRADYASLLSDTARDLGVSAPEMIVCEAISTPAVTGLLRPRLLLPHEHYDVQELRYILRHELCHLKRRDMLLKLVLLAAMRRKGVNRIIFSSSSTVYGTPETLPLTEDCPTGEPTNPYGRSKLHIEQILADVCRAYPEFSAVCLRYFNPIGSHPSALIGELPRGVPQNLVPYVTQTAAGIRECLSIFGNDYPTPDGTCIRDYIDIVDLARAHVAALHRLIEERGAAPYEVFNVGTGRGVSVLELVRGFERANGLKLNYRFAPRRAGDITAIWADPTLANTLLGWRAERPLEETLRTAWQWQLHLGQR